VKDKTLTTHKVKSGYALEKYTLWSNVSLASGGLNNLFTCKEITEETMPGSSWWCMAGGQERSNID